MAESIEEYKRRVARAGGHGRAAKMSDRERAESARKAALARWRKNDSLGETMRDIDGLVKRSREAARRAKLPKKRKGD